MKEKIILKEEKVSEIVYTTKMVPKTYYYADNGEVFTDAQECADYELFSNLTNFKKVIPQIIVSRNYFNELYDSDDWKGPMDDTLYFCRDSDEVRRVATFLLRKMGYNCGNKYYAVEIKIDDKCKKGWYYFNTSDGGDSRDSLCYVNVTTVISNHIQLNNEYGLTTDPYS